MRAGNAITHERSNLRRHRAEALAQTIMNEIGDLVVEHRQRAALLAITDVLTHAGVDIVTDEERERAGLPARGPEGYTDEELRIPECFRIELLMQPLATLLESHGLPSLIGTPLKAKGRLAKVRPH